ncbi:hypothetical protein V500_10938 [Pseudogymnoascus sp. VKM F-4518 (FW-2643)]|nr:hypothetical protein V500_10938 [Pseudogymnoascus sp. VKM F-4518 (FW-2643)]
MNPYVTNPGDIPATDMYADLPLYGRYFPRQDDFQVDLQHVNSLSTASLQYWASVVELCNESVRIYPADEGGRDVFALGSVIVKSSHLHDLGNGQIKEIDFSYADANEVQAIAIAKSILKDIRVPDIFFAGKVNGRQVLVQERLPGVGLNVAWQYLSQGQREAFKRQSREILRQLHAVKPTDGRQTRSLVVQDPNILSNGRILAVEGDILFSNTNIDPDLAFMHNDFNESNLIVENDRIVGVIDWEMAGFFGWKTAGEVHRRFRTPQREQFVNANLSEARLQEIMSWNDLYDDGMPELMACDTCASIASTSGDSPAEKQERSVLVDGGSLQKSAANGCLSCSLIQGIVQAGKTGESNVGSVEACVDKDGYLCASVEYYPTDGSIGALDLLYPFTDRETPWELIPIDKFTNPDPPTFESVVPLIQTWIQRCDLDHSCFKHGLEIPAELPTRVIDVGDSCHDPHLYITNGETGRFTALSHCWGPPQMSFKRLATTQTNLLAHCERMALDELPQTFRDAINVTRDLGLRYIWIDSLCIIQDSTEDWSLEVSRMADIYINAYVTLAADLAPNSDAGLFITNTCAINGAPQARHFSQVDDTGICHQIFVRRNWPKPGKNRRQGDVDNHRSCYVSEASSKLESRAWVLQESILSRRTVHFTNAELIWECDNSYECSCRNPMGGKPVMSVFKAALQRSVAAGDHSGETSNLASSVWHSVVEEFTARDLTYAKDRLPAISSLARMLPFPKGEYLAGLWQNRLMDDLIWVNPLGHLSWELDNNSGASSRLDTPEHPKNHRIQGEYAPSWSWASISAPVAFSMVDLSDITPGWRVTGARCMPITANPYGSVSKSSSLHVEGYVLPATFSIVTATKSIVDQNGNGHAAMEVCVVRGDKAFPGRNKTWFDTGVGGQEWRAEGYAYYALVIGYQADMIPLALVLRGRDWEGEEVYTRIGLVRLDNWKGHEWKAGGQQRAITIF